jgi:hypothetical protein
METEKITFVVMHVHRWSGITSSIHHATFLTQIETHSSLATLLQTDRSGHLDLLETAIAVRRWIWH